MSRLIVESLDSKKKSDFCKSDTNNLWSMNALAAEIRFQSVFCNLTERRRQTFLFKMGSKINGPGLVFTLWLGKPKIHIDTFVRLGLKIICANFGENLSFFSQWRKLSFYCWTELDVRNPTVPHFCHLAKATSLVKECSMTVTHTHNRSLIFYPFTNTLTNPVQFLCQLSLS